MAKAIVDFQGAMTFKGTSGSGHSVVMDSAPEVGGQNQGIRPMETLLVGLGGCTGMDVVSILNKMRVPFQTFRIAIDGERATEHPKVYTNITMRYEFEADQPEVEKFVRAVRLSQEKYCSVSAMLAKSARIDAAVVMNGEVVEELHQGG